MKTKLSVVILAAGQGTRMRSSLPKVLHHVADKPMLEHVIDAAEQLDAADIHVVYGHGGELVKSQLSHKNVSWVEQKEQLGTGHAVSVAMPEVPDENNVLVLYGDVPLIAIDTLKDLISITRNKSLALLTATLLDPAGYGRIVRENGKVVRIVEQKDAGKEELAINEVNTGFLAFNATEGKKWLAQLDNNNAQGEYYLTDLIAMAESDGVSIETAQPKEEFEILGVNNKFQLSQLERFFQASQAKQFMELGVTLKDPARFDVRGTLTVGKDVIIDINVVIEGRVSLGNNVHIGANSILKNCTLGDDVQVHENCIIEDSTIASAAQIGPFARLRPGSVLLEKTRIGNFVEVKNSQIGKGSKVNHLSYIGDTEMGDNVNVGAGSITCNYDGANKHKTIIEDNVFIGSSTQLVAPIRVGKGATLGAGTTATKDVPEADLTLSRAKQISIKNWKRPEK